VNISEATICRSTPIGAHFFEFGPYARRLKVRYILFPLCLMLPEVLLASAAEAASLQQYGMLPARVVPHVVRTVCLYPGGSTRWQGRLVACVCVRAYVWRMLLEVCDMEVQTEKMLEV